MSIPPIEPALGLLELETIPAGIEAGDGLILIGEFGATKIPLSDL